MPLNLHDILHNGMSKHEVYEMCSVIMQVSGTIVGYVNKLEGVCVCACIGICPPVIAIVNVT